MEDEQPKCTDNLMEELAKDEYCGLIKNTAGDFQECLSILAAKQRMDIADNFFDFCRFDVCELWDDPIERRKQVCDSLAAFTQECYDQGSSEIWFRKDDFCPSMLF